MYASAGFDCVCAHSIREASYPLRSLHRSKTTASFCLMGSVRHNARLSREKREFVEATSKDTHVAEERMNPQIKSQRIKGGGILMEK